MTTAKTSPPNPAAPSPLAHRQVLVAFSATYLREVVRGLVPGAQRSGLA